MVLLATSTRDITPTLKKIKIKWLSLAANGPNGNGYQLEKIVSGQCFEGLQMRLVKIA